MAMTMLKKKILIYGVSALFTFIIASLIARLAFSESVIYSLFWGALGAGVAITVARTVYHLALKDYAPEMWQISVYMAVACGGWALGIISTTWGWASLALAIMTGAILMAIGTRFCKEVAVQRTSSSLERTLRYELMDDRLGGTPNLDKPLILVAGTPLTIEEARRVGVSDDKLMPALAYIRKITTTGGR